MNSRLAVHYAGFGIACCYSSIAWVSLSEEGISLDIFYICLLIAMFFYIWPVAIKSYRLNTNQISIKAIVSWAIIFRFIGLIGEPLFEDDFYRYLWDGYQMIEHGNPYLKAPEEFFNDPDVPSIFNAILGNINYPEVPTVYGPGLQFLFGFCYWIKPAELWPLKSILIIFDLILIYILSRHGKTKNILLYAWNPLVIKEIAFTAHIDGLIPLLLIAAWLCQKQGKVYWMAFLIGLAVTVKIPAILFAPFLLWHANWKTILCFAMTVLACYMPFIIQGDSDIAVLFSFAQNWQFNSALYGLLSLMISGDASRYILGFVVMVWVTFIGCKQQRTSIALPRGDLIFAGLIFASPAINSWYWLWVLPFCVIYPNKWGWVASFSLLLSYITGLNLDNSSLQAYQQPIWVPWIEFGLITIAIYWDYYSAKKRQRLLRNGN